jgi:hypothetical protein
LKFSWILTATLLLPECLTAQFFSFSSAKRKSRPAARQRCGAASKFLEALLENLRIEASAGL